MESVTSASVCLASGEHIPLDTIALEGRISGLMGRFSLKQTFSNNSSSNIEAIYSFPLPFSACLLGLSMDLNGVRFHGTVKTKADAEADYEDAVVDGHSALMLTENEPGLYTLSIANIQPKDEVALTLEWSLPLTAYAGEARLRIPTTIANRYGDASGKGFEAQEVPRSNALVEYPFAFTLWIDDDGAAPYSPSHTLEALTSELGRGFTLKHPNEFADRDLVLHIPVPASKAWWHRLPSDDTAKSQIYACLPLNSVQHSKAANLKILIDCSGSMTGASVAIARDAVRTAIGSLTADDRYSLTAFGSNHRHFRGGESLAGGEISPAAENWIAQLNSDMGGTEMGGALKAAMAIPNNGRQPDILLITDGLVWDHKDLANLVKQQGHRIFTIGVGNSPVESTLQLLSNQTRGAVEFIAPREHPVAAIKRQINRCRSSSFAITPRNITPNWITGLPNIDAVFAGETVHLWMELDSDEIPPDVLEFSGASQTARQTETSTNTAQMLQKTGMHQRLRQLANSPTETKDLREELAILYQLISPLTNYILVAERTNPSQALPTTVVVPQMMATMDFDLACESVASYVNRSTDLASVPMQLSESSFSDFGDDNYSSDYHDIPTFLRRCATEPAATLDEFIDALMVNDGKPIPERIRGPQSLENYSLPESWLIELEALVQLGESELIVVASFWKAFVEMEAFLDLNREGKRRVKHWIKSCP